MQILATHLLDLARMDDSVRLASYINEDGSGGNRGDHTFEDVTSAPPVLFYVFVK